MQHRFLIALLSASLCTAATAASRDLQPGLWEITSYASMPGMPVQIAPQTEQRCYTTADLAQAQNDLRQGTFAHCKVLNFREQGDTANWSVTCSGEPAMRGTGTMTSTATTFNGSMDSVLSYPGGAVTMRNSWRAKRLGICK